MKQGKVTEKKVTHTQTFWAVPLHSDVGLNLYPLSIPCPPSILLRDLQTFNFKAGLGQQSRATIFYVEWLTTSGVRITWWSVIAHVMLTNLFRSTYTLSRSLG